MWNILLGYIFARTVAGERAARRAVVLVGLLLAIIVLAVFMAHS